MNALLVVPPLVKYLAGPPAGAAYLAGVDDQVRVLDLNAEWLRRFVTSEPPAVGVVGDHAKPRSGFAEAEVSWRQLVEPFLGSSPAPHVPGEDPFTSLWYEHDSVVHAARRLARSELGQSWEAMLPSQRPPLVGVSVLWSGQVVAALAVAFLCMRRWGAAVPTVFGGPHITALAPSIALDPRYGELVQGFVAGYAEGTFTQMLKGDPLAAPGVFRAGQAPFATAIEAPTTPKPTNLDAYGVPRLTLPIQLSRGCAYGRCAYCSYPVLEGLYRRLPCGRLESAVAHAASVDADISLKDAFVPPAGLRDVARLIRGRARWSASTRLVPRIRRGLLRDLEDAGLRTLELGVETFDSWLLQTIDKRQSRADLERLLDDLSGTEVHAVLNLMFGFPKQSAEQAMADLELVTGDLRRSFPFARFSTERNLLQVQRRSPLGRSPGRFGVNVLGSWPWASSLAWDAPAWRDELSDLMTGHQEVAVRSEAA